jgi:tripartite-type tricarboxylate transporter receptor subunit TctC
LPSCRSLNRARRRVLGVATQKRIPTLPQVPTVAESAVPGFAVEIWLGIAAPANVPPEVVARVGQAIHEAIELPEVQKRMSTLGLYVDFRNSEQFHELIVREHQKYGTIIREAGIQPE